MDIIKSCCKGSWWCCISPKEDMAEALAFSELPAEDRIAELLADIEKALEQKDGDVKKVPMSREVKNYASHLEKHLDKVIVGAQISNDTLNALGTLPWVGAGLTIIAMGLNMTLKMHDNREQCSYIMKESLDIWKKVMKPVHEKKGLASAFMEESMDIIIEGYLYCKNVLHSTKLNRFICAICHEKELESWKKKLEVFLLKAIAMMSVDLIGQLAPATPAPSTTFATTVVGLEEKKRDVIKLLKLEDKEETRVVVLYGMGGVGKSTLADAVYNQVSVSRERRRCRIELGENPSKDHIANMQKQMVENLTGQSLLMERDLKVITDKLRQVLSSETGDPFLIYIDNVLQPEHLEEFLSLDCELITLPKGSRWLVTTRDESVCIKIFGRNEGFKVGKFKMKSLNDRDAHKLFFLHAFGQEEPNAEVVEIYDDGQGLIKEMVSSICGNLPLALRVLGRSLFKTNVHAWRKKFDDLKIHGKLELEKRVSSVLQSSYNTLDDETQTAFLMICVCFYNCLYTTVKDVVESILPRATTSRLIELSLLERHSSSITDTRVDILVKMHDLVRTLGYQMAITRKGAPTKMLTCKQDFLDDDETWGKIKWLRVPPLEDGIEAELLEKCKELEVIFLETHVNGQIGNPPQQLKVVITSSSLPLELDKLKELVYLQVGDDIEEFPVAPSTRSLQVLKGFNGASIPKEAVDLHKNTLRKFRCGRIAELSSYFCQEMTKLRSLRIDDFQGESFPKEMGSLTSLEVLQIVSTTIQVLPQSLVHLRRLLCLSLHLENLKAIPSGVLGGMKELAQLQLHLESVTSMPMHDFGQLASLEILELFLPSCNRLTSDGVSLKLEKLKFFSLSCESMSSLEGVQVSCPSLECLHLKLGELEVLPPEFITGSTKLRSLTLASCHSLQELSAEMEMMWDLESLAVLGCPALKAIPEGLMKSVEALVLVKCPGMLELPGDVDEQKAGSMHLLACDKHLLPPQFLPLPPVVAYSQDDWRAEQHVQLFIMESFYPVSLLDALPSL